VKGHRFHVRRKIMKNEENRGIIHKKAYEDQLVSLVNEGLISLVLELSHYSLSLSHTLGNLDFSWITLGECGILGVLEQEGKGIAGKHKKESTSIATSNFLVGTKFHV